MVKKVLFLDYFCHFWAHFNAMSSAHVDWLMNAILEIYEEKYLQKWFWILLGVFGTIKIHLKLYFQFLPHFRCKVSSAGPLMRASRSPPQKPEGRAHRSLNF